MCGYDGECHGCGVHADVEGARAKVSVKVMVMALAKVRVKMRR